MQVCYTRRINVQEYELFELCITCGLQAAAALLAGASGSFSRAFSSRFQSSFLNAHFVTQGRSAFRFHVVDVEGTGEEKAGKIVFKQLQCRYERTRYVALLNLLVYSSSTRIQSAFRGHCARKFVSPRFRLSNHKSPSSPQVSNPVASSSEPPAHEELTPAPKPCKLKSASPPVEHEVVEVTEQASMWRAQVEAPRVEAKTCMPVWLLQVSGGCCSGYMIVANLM
jgi:hypothetical protein